jgi:hypothetical protein
MGELQALRKISDSAGDAVRNVIRAFHSSPRGEHFDRFDARYIGTGEGAQAKGYGLYFAGDESVSDWYRKKFSSPSSQVLAPYEDLSKYFAPGNVVPSYGGYDKVLTFHPAPGGQADKWAVEVIAVDSTGTPLRYERPRMHSTHPTLREVNRVLKRKPGTSYEVELMVPEESLLDWDAPISQQPLAIQNYFGDFAKTADADGQKIYRAMSSRLGREYDYDLSGHPGAEAASRVLLEHGVPGIRYLDGASRRAGEGTRNYVMFPGTEDRIRILRKYGLAPATLGAEGLLNQQPEESMAPAF